MCCFLYILCVFAHIKHLYILYYIQTLVFSIRKPCNILRKSRERNNHLNRCFYSGSLCYKWREILDGSLIDFLKSCESIQNGILPMTKKMSINIFILILICIFFCRFPCYSFFHLLLLLLLFFSQLPRLKFQPGIFLFINHACWMWKAKNSKQRSSSPLIYRWHKPLFYKRKETIRFYTFCPP